MIKYRLFVPEENRLYPVASLTWKGTRLEIKVKAPNGVEVKTGELSQFTGFLDQKGKEIYVGDLINSEDELLGVENAEVEDFGGMFGFRSGDGYPISLYDTQLQEKYDNKPLDKIKITGNIWNA